MLQMRHTPTGRVYNPDRDITHLFQNVAHNAMWRLSKDSWNAVIRAWAGFSGLQEKDLVDAGVALAKFLAIVKKPGQQSFQSAWADAGFDACAPAAVMAVMFELGVGFTGAFYVAVRESLPAYQSAPGASAMQEVAARLGHAAAQSTPTARAKAAEEVGEVVQDAIMREKEGLPT